ncbi:SpdD protein [Actinacidiphila glaucinigra]|uniref:SpdD protein n=1 Tax=Actinacidiphila glaucinigra TaxID=235986 RepID=UPI0036B6A58B
MLRPKLPAMPDASAARYEHAQVCSCSHSATPAAAQAPARAVTPYVSAGVGVVAAVVVVGIVLTALLATVALTAVAVAIAALVLRSLFNGTTEG